MTDQIVYIQKEFRDKKVGHITKLKFFWIINLSHMSFHELWPRIIINIYIAAIYHHLVHRIESII